jgi:putative ABC transport system permease protein
VSSSRATPGILATFTGLRHVSGESGFVEIAALAIVLGAGLGVTFGVVMVHAFVQSTDGQGLLSIPYSHIALYAAIAVCAALAAAALPARRAARTSVVSAMAQA